MDGAGNLYIADQSNNRIRKVSGTAISTVAGTGTNGYSGDSGRRRAHKSSFPYGIAVDSAGNLYIADSGNYRIRKVSGGVISTVAGSARRAISATAVGDERTIKFAYDVAGRARALISISPTRATPVSARWYLAGVITTVAGTGTNGYFGDGGLAAIAQINQAFGVAVDGAGSLYIADTGNYRILEAVRRIHRYDRGQRPFLFRDGGQAANAQLGAPSGLAVDNSGNLYISESSSDRVRVVSAGGMITTLAGGGHRA